MIYNWLSNNWIEIFGAATGIIYVFLEIRQKLWLWPVGIITSAVYIWVFFTGKLYADMSLQVYYLAISFIGWFWWMKGKRRNGEKEKAKRGDEPPEPGDKSQGKEAGLKVTRLKFKTGIIVAVVFSILFFIMWFVLDRLTDSPVPVWDSFITSLSVVATWMLARKIFEHWYLWIVVNAAAMTLFLIRGLYPTMVLYFVYCIMSFMGLRVWSVSLKNDVT